MRKNLTDQMEERGMKLRTWAKAKGLSDTDFLLLYQMNSKMLYGKWGRGAELRKLLEAEGFDTSFLDSCNSKDSGNSLDCSLYKSPRNDNMVVVG